MAAPQVPSSDINHPRMEKVDLARHHLTQPQLSIINKLNKEQFEKFQKLHPHRPKFIALFLSGIVASVYGYTMYRMSADNLVDEMEKEILENEVQK